MFNKISILIKISVFQSYKIKVFIRRETKLFYLKNETKLNQNNKYREVIEIKAMTFDVDTNTWYCHYHMTRRQLKKTKRRRNQHVTYL